MTFKYDLPNYGVFDEKRVFAPGPTPEPLTLRGVKLGMPICEDIWTPDVTDLAGRYGRRNPLRAQRLALRGGQGRCAAELAAARVTETGLPLIYLNQLGGQDELVFDGAVFVAQCRPLDRGGAAVRGKSTSPSPNGSAMRKANGFARRANGSWRRRPLARKSITP